MNTHIHEILFNTVISPLQCFVEEVWNIKVHFIPFLITKKQHDVSNPFHQMNGSYLPLQETINITTVFDEDVNCNKGITSLNHLQKGVCYIILA